MSRDNWEKLVKEVLKREEYRKLCRDDSIGSSSGSDSSASSSFSSSSRNLSFHPDEVPKLPNAPAGSRFDRFFGAARRFVTPVRKHPESQMSNLPQDINAPEAQSGYSAPTVLEVNELKEQTYNFGPEAMIAKGLYGVVYFAWLKSGTDVALKMLYASPYSDSNDDFLKNVSMVSRLKHENFVQFLGYSIESGHRILAYEFATMGTLHDILHGRKGVTLVQPGPVLDWMQRVRIALDTARGLEYLHENAVVHKDIRSSNILLFNDLKAKIADIHLSTKDPDNYINLDPLFYAIHPKPRGCQYHAPEFSMGKDDSQKSDIYSFGVVLLELLTGRKPVDMTMHMPPGQQNLVDWATPRLSEDKFEQCVDPKLKGEYPPKAAAKMAAIAALCIQYIPESQPSMTFVIKELRLSSHC